jgi:hypothetical protein
LRRLLIALLFALTIQSLASFASAVTIQPGKYQLEWGDITPYVGGWFVDLKQVTPDVAKAYTGLHSAEAYWGRQGKLTVVVDKTNPHGTYDVIYLIPSARGKTAVDLRTAVSQRLDVSVDDEQQGALLFSKDDKDLSLDWAMGAPGAQITRSVSVSVSIHLKPDAKGRRRPALANISWINGWSGTVKTDAGDLRVSVRDCNSNGVFGDRMSAADGGDSVLLYTSSHRLPSGSDCSESDLGEALAYKGRLYSVNVSPCGDSVEFQPYTGPSGQLVVNVYDANNKPTSEYSVKLFNDQGMYDYTAGESVVAPPGKYTASVFIDDKHPWSEQNHFYGGIRASMRGKLNLPAGSTVRRRFGGPMKLTIEPESKLVRAKRGQKLDVWLFFDIGGDEFGVTSMMTPKVTIRNSAGRIVNKGDGYYGCIAGGAGYVFQVGRNWKPGLYRITASLDPRPYQGPVTAHKPMRIEK